VEVSSTRTTHLIKNISSIIDQYKTETSFEKAPIQEITKENIMERVDQLNKVIEPVFTSVRFELHEKLNDYYVRVVNSENNQVVREIPSKKFLDRFALMLEYMGLIVDKEV